jgi:hypothetical protein
MFDELASYKNNNHFFFTEKVNLEEVCNAPKKGSGVYIIYELKNGRIELVYIGSSGKIQNNGTVKHRNGGLFDRIVNGHQFGTISRGKLWKQRLIDEKIEALDIYWYDTINSDEIGVPSFVEATIMMRFLEVHGRLPRWNKEF